MNNADAFDVDLFSKQFDGAPPLLDISLLAYEARTGKTMARKFLTVEDHVEVGLPKEAFADLLPGVAARLAAQRH